MNKRHKITIFKRIFIPLFVFMILQASIFYVSTVHGDIIRTLNSNSENLLNERVANRENELKTQFASQWGNLTYYCNSLNELYRGYQTSDGTFYSDNELKKEFLTDSYSTLYSMLRNNAVNGAFLILANASEQETLKNEEQSYYGLCLRDYDLTSGYTDKEDLMLLRCPSSIASKIGCSLDSSWSGLYTFSKNDPGDFFYKPLEQAYKNPGVENDNLTYFCGSHTYSNLDREVVSYSIPLITSEGEIYGVLGIELLTSYLSSLLPSTELQGRSNSSYMLVRYTKGERDVEVLATNGPLYKLCFDDEEMNQNILNGTDEYNVFTYTGKNDIQISGAASQLVIYNKNTPFENEIIAVVGIVRSDTLFAVSKGVSRNLLYIIGVVFLIGILAIFLVSRWLTRPITKLSEHISSHTEYDDTQLEHTRIYEIDQLIDAISQQSRTINQTKAQSEFFMMISHEIRTPLNAIAGYLNMDLEEHKKNGWNAEYLNRSRMAANQLSSIADEMLDYTKITDNSVQLKEELFDIKTMIRRMEQTVSLAAQEKGLKFQLTTEHITHEYLVGDKLRIELVMQHLLDNALKFTEKGGTIEAVLKESESEADTVRLEFECKDTGKGMSEAFCEQICAPFNQSDKSYSRTHGGLGIGLYLSRYFINAMHGTFDVESVLGEGSQFKISMIVKRPDSEAILNSEVKYPHIRAAIIGTDEKQNEELKSLLKRLQIKSDLFTDVSKAEKRVKARQASEYGYSLCVIDESGLFDMELLGRIKAIDSEIKIYICTNQAGLITEQAENHMIDKIIYKPIFQSVLYDAVMNTFGEYQSEDKVEEIVQFAGIRAMIVEDNQVNADILARLLKKMNVDSKVYENGRLAVDAFRDAEDGAYQIIFMDIQMPVMSGYEATAAIRASGRACARSIPIVAVSANAFQSDIDNSIASGMNDHIAKPVDAAKLIKAIRKYCQGQ